MLRVAKVEHSDKPSAIHEFSENPFVGKTYVTYAGEVGYAVEVTVEITLPYVATDDQMLKASREALFDAIEMLHAEVKQARQGDG